MATQKKIDTVAELTDKLGKAKSIVFIDYTGIKHKQLETLRKTLFKLNAQLVVTKNKLLLRAFGDKSAEVIETLKHNTAVLFNNEDEVAGIKELFKFFKAMTIGKTKGGMLGSTMLSNDDVLRLSKLPTKDLLLAQLAGQLIAPISGLHRAMQWNINKLVWGLDCIKNKKSK